VQTVGNVRRVEIEYGRNGVSRGKAEVLFNNANGANRCFEKLNKVLIDDREIKVSRHSHVVVGSEWLLMVVTGRSCRSRG